MMEDKDRILHNAGWIIGCKVFQAVIQLVIGMLTARYLGPGDYGLVNYAASLTAFVVPFMQLGLQATIVQKYILHPEKNGEIAGTCLLMTLISGLLSMLGVVGFSLAVNGTETTTVMVCALYSVSLVTQAAELLQYWFQAKMLSKHSSLAMLCAYAAASVYKVVLLFSGSSVYWFALSHAVEYGMTGLFLLAAYRRCGGQKLCFSRRTAKTLFAKSRYYIVAALMITVFHNTDHVMLKLMCGNAENGFYTCAVTCACTANFLYYGIIDAAKPVILENSRKTDGSFENSMAQMYGLVFWVCAVQGVAFSLLAEPIVLFLYGREFLDAVPVLRILIWQMPFSYLGSVRSIWILAAEQHPVLWRVNLGGIVANVCLNALLIPSWGSSGAAAASVATQFFVNFAAGFLMPQLRPGHRLMLRGLDPRYLRKELSALCKQHKITPNR